MQVTLQNLSFFTDIEKYLFDKSLISAIIGLYNCLRGADVMLISKKLFALCFVPAAFSFIGVYAHGSKDVQKKEVTNPDSWQETFDLTGKKAGKYNIMVTATDLGGNQAVEGPFNIYVDPKSDLPVCGITNPHQDMRIVGNLNIVGTCVDDDGVDHVDLVLDGDREHPVRAEGKEFWSYYLDTRNISEGRHSIEVTGTDINGLAGNPVSITWNLDRRQPVTAIENYGMGTLVSGSVKFKGTISDGNGIKSLAYSLDNGETFADTKITESRKNGNWTFDIPADTKKYPDGPSVIWFKATDNAGSEGIYSFLYFIDNTPPDVKIVLPGPKEVQNGKFAVAGYAKDTLGITKLSWIFGDKKGDFDLIPGNPYWSVEFDTTGSKDSSRKFTVSATDLAGNVIDVSRTIALNQELDKPVVTISEPTPETNVDENGDVFVRGIAVDDDGVQSVRYSLDGGEELTQDTKGVFYARFCSGADLNAGKHTVKVTAVDVNGVAGNPVSVTFTAEGAPPSFGTAELTTGKDTVDASNGIAVHPEAGSVFSTTASSTCGIAKVTWKITWGTDGSDVQEQVVKNALSVPVTIPISPDFPEGVVQVSVVAEDMYGRTAEQRTLLSVTDTTVIKNAAPLVVFDDSSVDENGVVQLTKEFPVSGYFTGGTASKVDIVPKTPFVTAQLDGNSITLTAGDAVGSSVPVKVRVTTDQGLTYESRELTFKSDTVVPEITINDASSAAAIDGSAGPVKIGGTVKSATGIGSFGYRVLTVNAAVDAAGLVTGAKSAPAGEFVPVDTGKDGSFSVEFDASAYGPGMYVLEFTASSAGGNSSADAVCVRNIPPLPEGDGKKAVKAKSPVTVWLDGFDTYYTVVYQGDSGQNFGRFRRSDMKTGANQLAAGSSRYTAQKVPLLDAHIALVDDKQYASGMNVVVGRQGAKETPGKITVFIDTGAAVSSVAYELSGDNIPGGDEKQTGSAKLIKPEENSERWTAEIPLAGLPVRLTNVKVTVKAGSLTKELRGTISVVRSVEQSRIDDMRAVYMMPGSGVGRDADTGTYLMAPGQPLVFYANVQQPVTAALVTADNNLSVSTEGNTVSVIPSAEGSFKNVAVKVTDSRGISYTSPAVNFIVDAGAPELHIETPALYDWVKTTVKISGTAADQSGIKSVEYSTDGGGNWTPFTLPKKSAEGVTFSADVPLDDAADGLVRVDIRAYDNGGHTGFARTAVYRDTTPPQVQVVLPLDSDVVNGDNLIAFIAEDTVGVDKAYYSAPPVPVKKGQAAQPQKRSELTVAPLIVTHIGTAEQPIDDAMSFEFSDYAGNTASVESWKFSIDSESDLPRAEIHLPADNEVLTRDFTISGVIYDDDGPSKIWYKIDGGEYSQLPDAGTSFSIDVPLSSMTDNEHTVTVYAVDVNGVKGPETVRRFRISLEEPKGSVTEPTIDTSVKTVVRIKGVASDKNGIAKVQVSLDNGNSYNDASGTENWAYIVDTRAIPDGTQVLFIKITDNYGITGLYSSLVNIDNISPELSLELPLDDSKTTGTLFFSGYAFDNTAITDMYITVRSLEQKAVSKTLSHVEMTPDRIITQVLDISSLDSGFYNIELTGKDKAGNITRVSRNIELDKTKPLASVDLLYPLDGEHKQGVFTVYGQAAAEKEITNLTLYIDDKKTGEGKVTSSGFFSFVLTPEQLTAGNHTYYVDATIEGKTDVQSRRQTVVYSPVGPWITVDNFTYGDFAVNRPYIKGSAGYSIGEDELLFSKTKEATKEQKQAVADKKVALVELSFDNGKTFVPLSTSEKWYYRVENQDITEGYHFLLLRATMKNGETAITRIIVQIDNTKPYIKLISPGTGGRYNQQLAFSGLTTDDVELKDVDLTLRKGDKASYEVPSFIQGLYFDWHFWGATLYDIGVGLTFFNDNVKLQFQWGQFTQAQRDIFSRTEMRYGGDNVMGVKILANVGHLPFSYFFGRNWEWLSASFAVGADFSRFNETNSGKPQVLSALLGQIEFPRVTMPKVKRFRTFSLYTEFSAWFIPTDISSTVDIQNTVFQIAEGIRLNVF